MTIRKGEPWGEPAVVRPTCGWSSTDRDAARLGDLASHARTADPRSSASLGGDLARTLRGRRRGAQSDRRPGRLPSTSMRVTLDDARADVGRRPRRRPPVSGGAASWSMVMNAQFYGACDVAPRSHPNDGKVDVLARRSRRWAGASGCRRVSGRAPARTCRIRSLSIAIGRPTLDLDFDTTAGRVGRRRAVRHRASVCGSPSSPTRSPSTSECRGRRATRAPCMVERHAGMDPRRVTRRAIDGGRSTCRSWPPTTCAIRVVASALNHMDLWVTRGAPKPPLPHVPGCDVAGVVDRGRRRPSRTVAVGDEVVVNPGVSPVADIEALGQRQPDGCRAS